MEEHDWEVTISEPRAVPKSSTVAEGSSLAFFSSGHLTGGGAEMTNPSGWGGVIRASTPIQEKAGKGIVWHARVQEHVETGTGDLNVYDIRIAPVADVRWELESKLFNKKGTNGQGSSVNLGVRENFILAGGGVQSINSTTQPTFPFRSVPRTSAFGKTEWFGFSGQYWEKASGSVEVTTVGLKLKSVP